MSKFLKVAVKAAKEGGFFLKKRLGRVKEISYKSDINLVTDVDKTSEKIIVRHIKKFFPAHEILAEENHTQLKRGTHCWIIDPLDGTTNFAHGFPVFCTSVALEIDGIILVGAVYDPTRDELFYAERGKGAFLNGGKIYVSSVSSLRKGLLATGFAYSFKKDEDNNIRHFANFLMSAQAIRRAGSAAIDLCYVACGRFDGFWELNLHPWDTAAATLIAEEAGGKVTRFSGRRYNHYDKDILASNGKIHSQMVNVLDKT